MCNAFWHHQVVLGLACKEHGNEHRLATMDRIFRKREVEIGSLTPANQCGADRGALAEAASSRISLSSCHQTLFHLNVFDNPV